MKQFILLFSMVLAFNMAIAQNAPCAVLLDSIKGTYVGDCANGKANGEGTASGTDVYQGAFKNGLPDGNGKYTWKNGDFFYGGWKKGLKEGKGEMHLPVNGVDSVIKGYWKKGVYKGEYETPYIVHNSSSDVGRIGVDLVSGGYKASITISVESLVGGGNIYSAGPQLTAMTNLEIIRGNYQSKATNALTNKTITTFQGVMFPFRARFYFNSSMVELEIFQEGDWNVTIPINNK